MASRPITIALTGLKFAGKGTFAEIAAKEFGYGVRRTRHQIMADAAYYGFTKPPAELTIAEMQEIGNAGRVKGGNGYWAKRLYEKAASEGVTRFIMDGVRHPDEGEALLEAVSEHGGLHAEVAIEASFETRFGRMLSRNEEGDAQLRQAAADDPVERLRKQVAAFSAMDDRDRGIGEPWHGQQVDACIAEVRHMAYITSAYRDSADMPIYVAYVLNNDGSKDAFEDAVRACLRDVEMWAERLDR